MKTILYPRNLVSKVFRIFTLIRFPVPFPYIFLRRQSRLQQTTVLNIFSLFFRKIRLDISCDYSNRQMIHMKILSPNFLRKMKVKKVINKTK